MGVNSRILEITIISGENVNLKGDDEAYVVVRAESIKCCTTKMVRDTSSSTIGLCEKGNSNNKINNCSSILSWNEKLLLDAPLHARSITFEVQSKSSKGNGRPIGVARIAISEILDDCNGARVKSEDGSNLHVLSYRLRDWDGRRNGVIHFAAREATMATAVPEGLIKVAKLPALVELVKDSGHEKKRSSGVVLGVPLWWNYPNII